MELNKKIVIDTKGGDKGAAAMIQGAVMALEKYPALELLLVGDAKEIEKTLAELNAPADRVEVLNAPGEITNYDNPAEAVFRKLDSSMIKALAALSRREDLYGLITSGNTGVLITACIRYLSGKERVRPTLAAVLPAANGGFVCLADAGATVDCTPQVLTHFARLGSKLMQDMYGIERPRVGLLSNGTESTKGNKLVKEAHALLAAEGGLNFVGNVEGNTALSGVCDVLVSDGFAGNLLLKVTEGTEIRPQGGQ